MDSGPKGRHFTPPVLFLHSKAGQSMGFHSTVGGGDGGGLVPQVVLVPIRRCFRGWGE